MLTCYNQDGEEVFWEICSAAYSLLKLSGDAVCELVFADEAEIQAVNLRTRGMDKPTDVLSFPYLSEVKPFIKNNYPLDYDMLLNAVCLGSVMICKEQAAKQAEEYGHSVFREESYLFTHGLLHLLGYDHETDADQKLMREKEEAILKAAKAERT